MNFLKEFYWFLKNDKILILEFLIDFPRVWGYYNSKNLICEKQFFQLGLRIVGGGQVFLGKGVHLSKNVTFCLRKENR